MKTPCIRAFILFFVVIQIPGACRHSDRITKMDEPEYMILYQEWMNSRLRYIKGPDGWLNLAGLYWLDEGENTLGSDSSSDIVLPNPLPDHLGRIYLETDTIIFYTTAPSRVTHNGEIVVHIGMIPDIEGSPTILEYGPYQWHIIKRGDLTGIRLRDLQHPAIRMLDSIPVFQPQLKWRVEAAYVPFETPYKLTIRNVLGQVEVHSLSGRLSFSIDGKTHTLYPMGTPPDLWLIFADGTSAYETYGGGRFLELENNGKKDEYIIDFNKAYNPPCAFTPFATCPLPPKENILDIKIQAGEKSPGLKFH